ncbi:hypothetical protein V8Z74_24550, partial [Comamonas sp. w2-DMI]|uniref:hypothetical protein n=1 Tax=Comamonas sp. w2-DMI TaxID=3126391 RepID=UPI0032E3AED2
VNRKANRINDLPTPPPRQCWVCVPPVIALKTRGPPEEDAQTQSDLQLAGKNGGTKVLVLYVNRQCTNPRVPLIPCSPTFRLQMGAALFEVREFLKEQARVSQDRNPLFFGNKSAPGRLS